VDHLVTQAVEQYGYLAIFLFMLLGSACIPIPSEVTMLFGGAFATTAVGGQGHLDFLLVGLIGTAGNLAGSWLAYWVGRAGGRRLAERWGRLVFVQPHDLDRAEAWFDRHGETAVLVSRMVPVIRSFISLPAGIAEMPLGKFSVYTILGSVPWTFALAAAGYWLGRQWTTVNRYLLPVSISVAVLTVGAVVWWVALQVRRRDRRPAPGDR